MKLRLINGDKTETRLKKKEFKQNIGLINGYPKRGVSLFTSVTKTKCLIIPSSRPHPALRNTYLISSLFIIVF